jgi:hypothetical protein
MTIKRLNYFTGQFLEENDFKDEQQYHVNAIRSHSKYLHTWGIAYGLDVIFSPGDKYVVVSGGMAVDGKGRQIILNEDEQIDLSAATTTTLYLTISYDRRLSDPTEETGVKGYSRITEHPDIKYDPKMPDEPATKILLAKMILDPDNMTIHRIDIEDRKYAGAVGGDMVLRSLSFLLPTDSNKLPVMRGIDDGIEVNSNNTIHTGNLDVAGILSGNLDKDMVGTDQIVDRSVPISKFKTHRRSSEEILGEKPIEIKANSEKEVHSELSNTHRFFITSVLPTTPDSAIEWKWVVNFHRDQYFYRLMVKNLSDKTIGVRFKYYDVLEE